jgi:hypothetical protein
MRSIFHSSLKPTLRASLHLEAVTPHAVLVLLDKLPAIFLCRVRIALEETVVS